MHGAARDRAAWTALGIALVAQTAVSISDQGVATLTAFITQDLELSPAEAGGLVAAIPLGRILGSYAAGRAVDRIGERTVLIAGAAATGLAVVLAATAQPVVLAGLFVATGVFTSTATPAGGKMVLLAFPPLRRGTAMGIRQTGIPLGGLIAALTVPWAAGAWGWRAGLAIAGALTLAGAAAAFAAVRLRPSVNETAVAIAGSGSDDAVGRLLRNRNLLLLTAWAVMLVGGQYVLVAFLPLHLHETAGMALPVATLFVALLQIGGIAGRLGWGVISDRLFGGRRRPPMLIITLAASAAFFMLGLLPGTTPAGAFGVAALLGGASVLGWQTIFVVSIAELAGPRRAGTATGFALTWVSVGIFLAPPLYGAIAQIAGGFSLMWVALAVTSALSLVPAALLDEPAHRHVDEGVI